MGHLNDIRMVGTRGEGWEVLFAEAGGEGRGEMYRQGKNSRITEICAVDTALLSNAAADIGKVYSKHI
jgi:hypothetical protein